jgi:hypothetical protein
MMRAYKIVEAIGWYKFASINTCTFENRKMEIEVLLIDEFAGNTSV